MCFVFYSRDMAAGKTKCINPLYLTSKTKTATITEVVQTMSEENKKKIREMGFGGILDLKVGKIPGKFAYHVVSQFDANTMELKVNNKSIKITEETVKELMDLPRGENKIPLDEKATKDKSSIEEWRMQFNVPTDASKILLSVVVSKLKRQKRPSLNFMRNWLVVMVNSLIQSGPNNYANQRILGTIENPEEAKKLQLV